MRDKIHLVFTDGEEFVFPCDLAIDWQNARTERDEWNLLAFIYDGGSLCLPWVMPVVAIFAELREAYGRELAEAWVEVVDQAPDYTPETDYDIS